MGVNIGFDVFDKINDEEMKQKEKKKSETSSKKVLKPIFIPEKRIPEFLKDYDCVVVNSFEDDDYHLTDEEKAEKNEFYTEFLKLNKSRNTVRKLPEYVDMMREAMHCLDLVAQKNGFYDPDEFKRLVLKGKIKIDGWKIPKFKGRDRKHISSEYISDFIMSEKDSDDISFIQKPQYEYKTEEELLEEAEGLFAEGELDRILAEPEGDALIDLQTGFDIEEDNPDGRNVVIDQEYKATKKLMREFPDILIAAKNARREAAKMDNISSMIYSLAEDDIKNIAMYDKKLKISSDSDVPEFKGNIFNDDDYNKYMLALDEWEDSQIYEEMSGKILNKSQINELELKSALEEAGWDLRKMYHSKQDKKEARRRATLLKKQNKKVREKLLRLNEKKAALKEKAFKKGKTMLFSDDEDIIDIDDKKKKKSKKSIKRDRKNKKKQEKERRKKHQASKKKAKDDLDEFLLGVADQMSGDFDDYSAESLDWSWEGIMNHPEDG